MIAMVERVVPVRQCSTHSSGVYHLNGETSVLSKNDQFCTHERPAIPSTAPDVVSIARKGETHLCLKHALLRT